MFQKALGHMVNVAKRHAISLLLASNAATVDKIRKEHVQKRNGGVHLFIAESFGKINIRQYTT